ncbi:hypothetical protein HPB50_005266 [Hyalomma asiaticum]|uniref:Uncharacterized protein n=1 Tax=Hyalomma asiaticum TaxID=266040 RepID=A0ACB7T338_HYAAI|nr:hypothetical protein HPB50_005266 [Hyalomma asiaticum]
MSSMSELSESPGLRRYLTVCTVSYLESGLALPLNGECDIIYYDSLLLRPEDTFMGTFTNDYLKPIFDAAKDPNVTHNTQFGMSIHAPAINDFSGEVKTAAGLQHYKDHWQRKVFNWGVLNIHGFIMKNTPDILKTSLSVLKELKDTAAAAGHNASMVVGLFCKATGGCDRVTEYFKTIFLPDGVLVLGHITYRDNNISDCTMIPNSILDDPLVKYNNLSYMHSLVDSVNTVRYLQDMGFDTMYAVTATLAGRWYRPLTPDNHNIHPGKYRPGNKCEVGNYPQKAHIQDVCGNKSFAYTEHFRFTHYHLTAYTWDKKEGYTITYDSNEALERKYCFAFDNNTDLLVGISAYDANYDAAPRNCSKFKGAPWSRLKWLNKMRGWLDVPTPYSPSQFLSRCLYTRRNHGRNVLRVPRLEEQYQQRPTSVFKCFEIYPALAACSCVTYFLGLVIQGLSNGDKKRFTAIVLACCALMAMLALMGGVYATTNLFADDEHAEEGVAEKPHSYAKHGGGTGASTTSAFWTGTLPSRGDGLYYALFMVKKSWHVPPCGGPFSYDRETREDGSEVTRRLCLFRPSSA